MTLLKRLTQLSIAILLLSVLTVSFHYHGDLADHPECSICKVAKTLSAAKKPPPPLLPSHVISPHHLSAGVLPTPVQCPIPQSAGSRVVANKKICRDTVPSRPASSRASPSFPSSEPYRRNRPTPRKPDSQIFGRTGMTSRARSVAARSRIGL